jgi:hypothetical protein
MSEPSSGRSPFLIPAGVLAVGILLAATVFGSFFYSTRTQKSTIQVVGSANERFTSDVAKWRLTISRQVGDLELASGYAQLQSDLNGLIQDLQDAGIDSSVISIQPVNAHPMWGPEGRREGYNVTQGLYVLSEDPDKIESLALNPGQLLEGGVLLEGSYIEYYYSRIAELKHSLLAKATADARSRASEIAGEEDGRNLGAMISGRAGVFQITEPYSTDVSGGGMHSTSTKEKEISVTVHATFEAN